MYRRSSKTGYNKPVTRKYAKRSWKSMSRAISYQPAPTNFGLGAGQRNRSDGLPSSMMQKLRYTGYGKLITTNVINNFSAFTYNLDPYAIRAMSAPVAHQPTFFDQYGGLYTNQRVRAWKIRISASNDNLAPVPFASTLVAPGNSGAQITSFYDLSQDNRSKTSLVGGVGAPAVVHKHYHTVRQLAGNVDVTDDTYAGSQATPAAEYPLLVVGTTNYIATVTSLPYIVQITFFVEFYSPITASASAI